MTQPVLPIGNSDYSKTDCTHPVTGVKMDHFNTSESSTVVNGSVCGSTEITTHPFFMVGYGLIFLVSLVSNSFTVRVYFCRAVHHHSCVTVYLKNLATADFFLSLCLPLRIANYASGSALMRNIYCTFGATTFYLNMYASMIFMVYIAANRYLKIVHPLETHRLQTVHASHVISITTWSVLLVMSCVYLIPSLVSWGSASIPGVMGCNALHSRQVRLLYKILHSCLAVLFLVVLVSLVLFYRGTSRRLRQMQQTHKGSCKKLNRSKRNMLVLVSVFCVCFVPYHLVRVPYALLNLKCAWDRTFYYLKETTVLLSVLSACLDPLIYFIFCKNFRAQLRVRKASYSTEAVASVQLLERRASGGQLTNPSTHSGGRGAPSARGSSHQGAKQSSSGIAWYKQPSDHSL